MLMDATPFDPHHRLIVHITEIQHHAAVSEVRTRRRVVPSGALPVPSPCATGQQCERGLFVHDADGDVVAAV